MIMIIIGNGRLQAPDMRDNEQYNTYTTFTGFYPLPKHEPNGLVVHFTLMIRTEHTYTESYQT